MERCETCVHWHIAENQHRAPDGFGECFCPSMLFGYYGGENELVGVKPFEVVIENDEGWGMFTGPQFGCVHHTAPEVA